MAAEGRARRAARVLLVLALVYGCGRIGVELKPASDGGAPDATPDATVELPRLCDVPGCFDPGCPGDPSKTAPGVCGCGHSDVLDSDHDGVADCVDFCPGMPDLLVSGTCACAAAQEDSDGDGVANCEELCPFDPAKQAPGLCGCSVIEGGDADGDGTPDCDDACPLDPSKQERGACGCGVDERDEDLDTIPDCIDPCTVQNQASYVPKRCGLGYCLENSTPSRCVDGIETPCTAPAPPVGPGSDTTCDGIDEDCDGAPDDNYQASTFSCGVGACENKSGFRGCDGGKIVERCEPYDPRAASDVTCDGIDDDCDGKTDESFGMPTTCTGGACTTTGVLTCVNAEPVDSCMVVRTATDTTCDGIDDDCDGVADDDYVAVPTTCGRAGTPCARTGQRRCVDGRLVDTCAAGTPAALDSVCNGIDDDCDGRVDDDFTVTGSSCGVGVCARTGSVTCVGGAPRDSCAPGAPTATRDDAFVPGNGLDDDCDGRVDEDVPSCTASTRSYEPGSYVNLSVPGNCHTLRVELWGGGGASGEPAGIAGVRGGTGGAGGYATINARLVGPVGPVSVYVGTGAASSCENPGTNPGSATYNGGNGGASEGAPGGDGVVVGGGAGGAPSSGWHGGRGHYGGGGGGEGKGGLGNAGGGGGGGAASVLLVNNARVAVAGGGGGGGGAQATTPLGTVASAGGDGGPGCGAAGQVGSGIGGGGGGGGMCQGATVQSGSGVTPAMAGSIPSGRARGGSGDCGAGGAGYAIVSFAP